MSISSYMTQHAFGDYRRADHETREEMESAALDYAAREQTSGTIFKGIGASQQAERYHAGTATAADLRSLESAGTITPEEASAYRAAHGWTPRKF